MTQYDAAKMLLNQKLEQYGQGGRQQAVKDLELSETTLSQYLSGKYNASTKNIDAKILRMYSTDGDIECRVLGSISLPTCTGHFQRAKKIGMKAGNPDTLRLYKACIETCALRKKEA